MVLVPSDDAGAAEAPLSLARVIEPYYLFQDSGVEVVLASPAGGSPWSRRADEERGLSPQLARRFRSDQGAQDAFADSLELEQVFVEDFHAAFCVGAITSIWLAEAADAASSIIAAMLIAGKPVAIIPDGVDLAPAGAGEGLLILGHARDSPFLAAQAMLRVIRPR